jgi:hypothetical protein
MNTVTYTNKINQQKTLPKSLGLFPRYELPEIELHHPYTQKRHDSRSSIASSISSNRQQQCTSTDPKRKNTCTSSHVVRSLSNNSNNDFHRSFSSSSRQQRQMSFINNYEEEQNLCTIEPSYPLQFLCEISPKTIYAKVVHLKITNPSSNTWSFSLFSSKNMLEFEINEGTILENEVVDIQIKIQSSALLSYRRQQPVGEYPSLHDRILVLIDRQYANELDVQIDFISLEEEEDDKKVEKQSGRPKCRYCALEKGYPLHCL